MPKSRKSVALSKSLRKRSTDAERLLWKHLQNYQLDRFKFRRQEPIGNYIVDFVCYQAELVVEADGSQHVDNQKDEERDRWLKNQGYHVLRFSNREVLTNTVGVFKTIHFHCLQSLERDKEDI